MSCRIGLLALCLHSNTFVQAEQGDDSPLLQIHSQHAYNAVFGLPGVAARPVQSREWQLSLEHSNQFVGSRANNEQLILDGETSELTFRHRQRLAPCWQGEVLVPFLQHSGGVFDRAIDDWHQFFGLPDADRSEFSFNAMNYSYSGDSGQQQVDSPESGLGDIQLSVQRSLGCQATADSMASETIVRAGIKLPTGTVGELRGSGRIDTYVDIQSPVWSNGGRWRGGATVGLMIVGRQSRQYASQRPLVVFGALGTQFMLRQRYRLMLQVDWHTPFYNSALDALNDPSFVLSAGVRYLARRDQTLELTIGEDIAVDTAPDIVARLAWIYRPRP